MVIVTVSLYRMDQVCRIDLMANPKLKLAIAPAILAKLARAATDAGLPVEVFVATIVSQYAVNGMTSAPKRLGRPPLPVHTDNVPLTVEHAATPSGFAGVTKKGRVWEARAGKTALGRFSTAELAATVRHYALLGFKVGRSAYFREDTGLADPVEAMRLAAIASRGFTAAPPIALEPGVDRSAYASTFASEADIAAAEALLAPPRRADPAGAPPPPIPAGDSGGAIGPGPGPSRDDPPAGPGPAEGSRATPADGRAPSTLGESVARGAGESQVLNTDDDLDDHVMRMGQIERGVSPAKRRVSARWACPVCKGDMNRSVARKHRHLCLLCSADYDVWRALPATGEVVEPPADGVYVSNPLGSTAGESFEAYVKRTRGAA
jgi:hypothetical protein